MNEEIAAELHALNENIRELTKAVRELNNDTHKQYVRESLGHLIDKVDKFVTGSSSNKNNKVDTDIEDHYNYSDFQRRRINGGLL